MESAYHQLINDTQKWVMQESHGSSHLIVEGYQPPKAIASQPAPEVPPPKKQSKQVPPQDYEHVEVFLISQSGEPAIKGLCERLTSAIDSRIAKAKYIDASFFEKNGLWPELHHGAPRLRHVLISEVELYQLPGLLKHYERSPKRLLFNAPLFLLADLSSYLKDVELKKNLWATLLSEI